MGLLLTTLHTFGQWPYKSEEPVGLSVGSGAKFDAAYTWDKTGNTYYIWTDFRSGNGELYFQKLDVFGNPQFAENGIKVGEVVQGKNFTLTNRVILPMPNGNVALAWHSIPDASQPNNKKVEIKTVSSDGKVTAFEYAWLSGKTVFSNDVNTALLALAYENEKIALAFNDYRGGSDDIYLVHFDSASSAKHALLKTNSTNGSKAVFDEENQRIVLLSKQTANEDYLVAAFDLDGTVLISDKQFLLNPPNFNGESRIDFIRNTNGQTLIGRTLEGTSGKKVIAQKLDKLFNNVWHTGNLALGSASGYDLQVEMNSDGGATMAWIEPNSFTERMMMARVDGSGNLLWKRSVFQGQNGVNYFSPNKFTTDQEGGGYSLWFTPKNGGFDLSIQHLDKNGNRTFGETGIAIDDFNWFGVYRLLPHPKGGVVAFYSGTKEADINTENYDLYTNFIDNEATFGLKQKFNVILEEEGFCPNTAVSSTSIAKNSDIAKVDIVGNGGMKSWDSFASFTHIPEDLPAGHYVFYFTDSEGMISDSLGFEMYPSVVPANVQESLSVFVGETIALTASGGATYTWSGPQAFASTTQNPSLPNASLAMSGTYSVNIENEFGCSATAQTVVSVQQVLANEPNFKSLVYPNPSRDQVRVTLENDIVSVWAVSPNGQKQSLHFEDKTLDVRVLKTGLYLIKIRDKAKRDHTFRFMKN